VTFAFVLIHRFIYMAIQLQLVGGSEAWIWSHTLLSALVNGLAAVVLFAALDKFKLRINGIANSENSRSLAGLGISPAGFRSAVASLTPATRLNLILR